MFPPVRFSNPWALWVALLPLLLWIWRYWLSRGSRSAIDFPAVGWLPLPLGRGLAGTAICTLLRLLAFLALVPVIAGIEVSRPEIIIKTGPSVLMIVLDTSTSMTAEDFGPESRLQTAKALLKEFVKRNHPQHIGLLVFAATPRLLVPATPEHAAVISALDRVQPAEYGRDGTAIGSALASAINRIRAGQWGSRKILLITDGVSNRGMVAPLDAASLAGVFGISIDAIGIGTDSPSRYWVPRENGIDQEVQAKIEIDDDALTALAVEAGGSYRRVRNSEEMRRCLLELSPGQPSAKAVAGGTLHIGWLEICASICLIAILIEHGLREFYFAELPS